MGVKDALITASKAAAFIPGKLNQAGFFLQQLLDPQFKNVFEMLLYPQSLSFNPASIAHAALDTAIAKLHVQSIEVTFPSLEYDAADIEKYVKGITNPETVVFTLLENDLAFVRNYYQSWMDMVYVKKKTFMSATSITLKDRIIFKSDQEAVKKNAKIFMQTGTGLPSPGWITLEGLRPKQLSTLSLEYSAAEPYIIQLTCSVDWVQLETIF